MIEIAELLRQIEEHCAREGIAETTFGFRAVNDGKFVSRLRSGSSITLRTLDAVQKCLSGQVAAEQPEIPEAHP